MAKNSAKKLATNQRKRWQQILQTNVVPTETDYHKLYRIVLDTNIWYSAILYGGSPENVIRIALNNCQLITSIYIINEIKTNLKMGAKAPYRWLNLLEKHLIRTSTVIEIETFPPIVRDPQDDPIIATAIQGQCDYLVTGDNDLLSLKSIDFLEIITANQFLDIMNA